MKILKILSALAAGLVATTALAVTTVQTGWNPATGLNGTIGLEQTVGTPPTAATSTCASGTVTVLGGPAAGSLTTTTCTTFVAVLIWSIPSLGVGGVAGSAGSGYSQAVFAPTINGAYCSLVDVTTGADNTIANTTALGVYVAPTATANGSLTCTFASKTIVAGDVLIYQVQLF